jgi:hypothetical protein
MQPLPGRLVLNHSTHVDKLIPVLKRLTHLPGIRTITPGVIAMSKGNAPRLQLRISVPILGGFKLMARRGKSVQEVFILTHLNQAELEAAIAQVLQ